MRGWQSIEVFVNGQFAGTLRRYFEPDAPRACEVVADARVVVNVQPGTVTFSARSDRGSTWESSRTLSAGECLEVRLNCTNRDCSPSGGAPPPAGPAPPPPGGAGFHVWGGANYSQYLGFFTCVFCVEYDRDSINNEFGMYGSKFSPTSIRNQFSQYGSDFSSYSACNRFASSPPKVYNANRSVYYGELTRNEFRSDAINEANVPAWLARDVCVR
jgi:hypothetical protein